MCRSRQSGQRPGINDWHGNASWLVAGTWRSAQDHYSHWCHFLSFDHVNQGPKRVILVKRNLCCASAKTSCNPSDSITALATPMYTLLQNCGSQSATLQDFLNDLIAGP